MDKETHNSGMGHHTPLLINY